MFLVGESSILDYDLDLFGDVAAALDRHISAAFDGIDFGTADMMGLFDRAEYAAGLGFVASQAYLAATYGDLRVTKVAALSLGPSHGTGGKVVAMLNAAANFWKHSPEWQLQGNHPGRRRTVETLDAISLAVNPDYPLLGILGELTSVKEPRLLALVPLLAAWRDELARQVEAE